MNITYKEERLNASEYIDFLKRTNWLEFYSGLLILPLNRSNS